MRTILQRDLLHSFDNLVIQSKAKSEVTHFRVERAANPSAVLRNSDSKNTW